MYPKTKETKVLRDPVHGYIHVDEMMIWELVNSHWFQRLRRIRQLGGAFVVYHTAEHSRFSHCLGVYEIVRRMVSEVPDLSNTLTEKEKLTVMAAALLHDLGHGPYSHAFEAVSNTNHEVITCRIIERDPEIRGILEKYEKGMSKCVADVIRHKSENPLLSQMISSQLDADRMDYLLRDAYFTGTAYGEFDLARILRTLRVVDGKLVIKESGVYAVENYIMARYHMYWQVYYHPVARSYEMLLHLLFQRMRDLKDTSSPCVIEPFYPLILGEKLSLQEYYELDDYVCGHGFAMLQKHEDPILSDLAKRIMNRDLLEYDNLENVNTRKMRALLREHGFDPDYYFQRDEVSQSPYVPYSSGSGSIFVTMDDGRILELSNASNIVYSLTHGPVRDEKKVFFPKISEE